MYYRSCHPQHTKNNIFLSLGQKIIQIASENNEQHLNELKSCLIHCGHPEEVLDYTMTKVFSSSFKSQNESTDYITFVQTYNPNTKFNKNIINNTLNDFHDNLLKKAFEKKKPLLANKQAKSFQNFLIEGRFDVVPKPIAPQKYIELYNSQDKRCLLHCHNYINPYKEFKFKLKSGRYYIYFDCKSRDVICLIICINCEGTYTEETECLREPMNNTKSSIRQATASFLPYTQHISRCRNLKDPLFKIYPFYYESDLMFRKSKERCFIKPTLNGKF